MPRSIVLPADIRSPASFERTTFKPKRGAPIKFAYKRHAYLTPNKWRSKDAPYAARIFVGFSVGQEPTYSMMDLIRIVKRERREQTGAPDSSFVYQKGVFTHESGETVTEDAAQVVILNLDSDTSLEEFQEQMIDLADTIRVELEQESVILELQKGGVTIETFGIDAEDWE